jgi:hypothetical protein
VQKLPLRTQDPDLLSSSNLVIPLENPVSDPVCKAFSKTHTCPGLILRKLLGDIVKLRASLQLGEGFFFLAMLLALRDCQIAVSSKTRAERQTRICRTLIYCAPLTLPPFSSSSALPFPFPFAAPPLSAALPFGAMVEYQMGCEVDDGDGEWDHVCSNSGAAKHAPRQKLPRGD